MITDNGIEFILAQGTYDRDTILRAYADGYINSYVWDKLYKSRLWEKIRFPVGRIFEDIATIHKVFYLCRNVFVLNEVMCYHRVRQGSITNVSYVNSLSDYIWALSEFEAFANKKCSTIIHNEQLQRIHELKFCRLIYSCIICIGDKSNEKANAFMEIKKQILLYDSESLVKTLSVPYKTAYYLIRYCPCLLRIAYPVYHQIRTIQRKVIGAFGK